ncbi:MAG TPA: molybdopterin cofactor-binding domain-containing protein [Bryobacteraceae bacterium]|nr:molybdopterin cofactor-binding domain-containing protein [Bryobacteraceae bacterium]
MAIATEGMVRREFFSLAGAGLYVFLHAEAQEPARLPGRQSGPTDLNAYLKIGADGRVTCLAGKVELGQGAMTELAQVLAEELDVPFDAVDVVTGDTGLCPYDMGTFGSMCTPLLVPVVRRAAAEARAVLVLMASERLKVPATELGTGAGAIRELAHPSNRATYSQLVEGKRIERHLENIPLKASDLRVIGTSPRRKDGPDKVTGRAQYAGDGLLPGLLHAAVLRPPAHGAKLKTADTSAAEKITGLRVVKEGGMIAVLHERPDIAREAVAQIEAEFENPPAGANDKTIFDHIRKIATQPRPVGQSGDLAEGERLAGSAIEHTYLNSYVAHSPMETHSATAQFENGKVTVWASTQAPFMVKNAVSAAMGLPSENVRVVARYVGGGFGGKTAADQAVEAARLSKITGRPVQVVYSRAEEFFFDNFRPAAVMKIRAGAAGGKIVLWDSEVLGAGEREANPFYDIPHRRITSVGGWQGGNPPGMHPFAVGPWRAPSVNSTTFARESHIDVLAAKAGIDPLEFRLNNLTHPRIRRVLETAARQFGWKSGQAPSGRGFGMACGIYSNACNATMVEVAVSRDTGAVQVKRVVMALDVGMVVNPNGMRQQAEGSVIMGLGYSLSEEVRFRNGEVLDHNFDTYRLPRFSWLPEIDIAFVNDPQAQSLGGGEPPIISMGGALANAIFDAVGARVLQLPMTPERVKAALA